MVLSAYMSHNKCLGYVNLQLVSFASILSMEPGITFSLSTLFVIKLDLWRCTCGF